MEGQRRRALFAFATIEDEETLKASKVPELDAWQCREEFFGIREGDNQALVRFLAKTGLWLRGDSDLLSHWSEDVMRHWRECHVLPIDVQGLWRFREGLRRALADTKAFKETYAPLLERNESGSGIEFPMRFELTRVPSGVLDVPDTYHALLSTVFFDVARGIRFKKCARPDCTNIFPIENKRPKKFCQWYCGHITTVRKNRPHKNGQRAKN